MPSLSESVPRPPLWVEVADILIRQRRVITLVLIAGVVSAALMALLGPPSFSATTKLMVTSDRPRMTVSPDPKDGTVIDRVTDHDLNAEAEMLKSPLLVREVIAKEPPQGAGAAAGGPIARAISAVVSLPQALYRWIHDLPPPNPLDLAAADAAARLTVAPIRSSNLIEVSYQGDDPQQTADFVNRVATHHVERRAEMSEQAAAQGFFGRQRELLTERLRTAEEALREFHEREGLRSFPEEHVMVRAHLTEVETAIARSSAELAESKARIGYVRQQIETQPKTLDAQVGGDHDAVQLIHARVLELELQRSALLATFAPESSRVAVVDKQLAEARALLAREKQARGGSRGPANRARQYLELNLAQTGARIAAVEARLHELESQREQSSDRLIQLDRIAPAHGRLQQQVAAAKEALDAYQKKEEQARFATALGESRIVNVTVVEPAAAPLMPENNRAATLALGTLLSCIAALAAAFLCDRADPTVKSAREAAAATEAPVLAELVLEP